MPLAEASLSSRKSQLYTAASFGWGGRRDALWKAAWSRRGNLNRPPVLLSMLCWTGCGHMSFALPGLPAHEHTQPAAQGCAGRVSHKAGGTHARVPSQMLPCSCPPPGCLCIAPRGGEGRDKKAQDASRAAPGLFIAGVINMPSIHACFVFHVLGKYSPGKPQPACQREKTTRRQRNALPTALHELVPEAGEELPALHRAQTAPA